MRLKKAHIILLSSCFKRGWYKFWLCNYYHCDKKSVKWWKYEILWLKNCIFLSKTDSSVREVSIKVTNKEIQSLRLLNLHIKAVNNLKDCFDENIVILLKNLGNKKPCWNTPKKWYYSRKMKNLQFSWTTVDHFLLNECPLAFTIESLVYTYKNKKWPKQEMI